MTYSHHTAADLGITGPHLACRSIDAAEHVVTDVLGYDTEWCLLDTGGRHDVVVYRYRLGPHEITGRATTDRFEVKA